jgi:hypothetical protein
MVAGMPGPGDISEDRGFKALFASYPRETIEVFVPELLAERGQPTTVEMLRQESLRPELAEPSRFLDIAVLAGWSDGSQAVVLLVEHWSEARTVDLRRVLWYVADLALSHPHAAMVPVVLVTDPRAHAVPDRLEMNVVGITTVALRVRISRVSSTELPRLRSLQNRVAALLLTLAITDAAEAVLAMLEQMARSPGPLDDMKRFLPFAMKLARMQASDLPRFLHRLQETAMSDVITEERAKAFIEELEAARIAKIRAEMMDTINAKAEAIVRAEVWAEVKAQVRAEVEAKVRAEVEAEGSIQEFHAVLESITRLVARGVLSLVAARAQIHDLIESGAIPPEIGQAALAKLT